MVRSKISKQLRKMGYDDQAGVWHSLDFYLQTMLTVREAQALIRMSEDNRFMMLQWWYGMSWPCAAAHLAIMLKEHRDIVVV
jgi:hypothetical protein